MWPDLAKFYHFFTDFYRYLAIFGVPIYYLPNKKTSTSNLFCYLLCYWAHFQCGKLPNIKKEIWSHWSFLLRCIKCEERGKQFLERLHVWLMHEKNVFTVDVSGGSFWRNFGLLMALTTGEFHFDTLWSFTYSNQRDSSIHRERMIKKSLDKLNTLGWF